MNAMNAFEYAAKHKMRFQTPMGGITVEDCFGLPLTSVRGISLESVSATVLEENSPRKSLVSASTTDTTLVDMKIEVLTAIIDSKKAEAKAKLDAKAKADRIVKIKEALAEKDLQAIASASKESLESELKALMES